MLLQNRLFGTKGLGANVEISGENTVADLFSETQSRFIVSVKEEHKNEFEKLVPDAKVIGQVTDLGTIQVSSDKGDVVLEASVEELESAWKGAIPCLLKSKV